VAGGQDTRWHEQAAELPGRANYTIGLPPWRHGDGQRADLARRSALLPAPDRRSGPPVLYTADEDGTERVLVDRTR